MAKIEETVEVENSWTDHTVDNGKLVAWRPGVSAQGIYVARTTIDLPVSEQNPDGGEAEMLVFSDNGERWSTWLTFQIREAFEDIEFGREVSIECVDERKAKIGNVLVFRIRSRNAQPRKLAEGVEPF